MIPRLDPALLATPSTHAGGIALVPGLPLAAARVHELTGPARRTLALMLAARLQGPVVWIGPRPARPGQWHGLMPQGAARWIDPGRVLLAAAPKATDRLWAMEEALRSRAARLVVAELEAAPALTPVRRLLLAAEGGTAMGLILTPEGDAPGVESRWRLTPAHRPGQDAWRLDLLRARMVPPASWTLRPAAPGAVTASPEEGGARAAALPPPRSDGQRRAEAAFPWVPPIDCPATKRDPRRGPCWSGGDGANPVSGLALRLAVLPQATPCARRQTGQASEGSA